MRFFLLTLAIACGPGAPSRLYVSVPGGTIRPQAGFSYHACTGAAYPLLCLAASVCCAAAYPYYCPGDKLCHNTPCSGGETCTASALSVTSVTASAQSVKSGGVVHFVLAFTCRVSMTLTKATVRISATGQLFDLPLQQTVAAGQSSTTQFDVDLSDTAPGPSADAGHTFGSMPASTSQLQVLPMLVSAGDPVAFAGDEKTIAIETTSGTPGNNCPTTCPSGGGICAPAGCSCPPGTKYDGGICDGNPNGCGHFCSAGTRVCNC